MADSSHSPCIHAQANAPSPGRPNFLSPLLLHLSSPPGTNKVSLVPFPAFAFPDSSTKKLNRSRNEILISNDRLPILATSRIRHPALSRNFGSRTSTSTPSPNSRSFHLEIIAGQFLTCTDQLRRFPFLLVPTTYHGDFLVTLFARRHRRVLISFHFVCGCHLGHHRRAGYHEHLLPI